MSLTAKSVRKRIVQCERCELSSRPGILPVPFSGSPRAGIAIVGEAPGEFENDERRPFSPNGASGRLLRKLLLENDIDPKMCFICNTVSCWPGGTPEPEHEKACRVHLKRQLALSQAKYVLSLGAVALRYFDPDVRILQARKGKGWFAMLPGERLVLVTVHPAYALRFAEGRSWLKKDIARFARLVAADQ